MRTPGAATGTVYALIDPRDGTVQYIGQTTKTLAARLRGGYAPRVRSWMDELRTAGLKPRIVAVIENVLAADLDVAETGEITRIIAGGGSLLNESATALGRELYRERCEAARAAAERAAWAELGGVALAVLGGPIPPGDLPAVDIPDVSWDFISSTPPVRQERDGLLRAAESSGDLPPGHYALLRALDRREREAGDQLWWNARRAWGEVRGAGSNSFDYCMERNFRLAMDLRFIAREDVSRFLGLTVWYMVAVHPWRHLAELGGLPLDDGSFIEWAGRDSEVRDSLTFLAALGEGVLEKLSARWDTGAGESEPGRILGAVTAAYSGTAPEAIRSGLAHVLGKMADDHELTRPMADMLMRLNPRALDSVFGRDIAADVDREFGLANGTSGAVLRALIERAGYCSDGTLRRAADRSVQALPMTEVPDYGSSCGFGVISARSVAAHLVRAGLAKPIGVTKGEYLDRFRAYWAPRTREGR